MKRVVILAVLAVLTFGGLSFFAPAPEAAPPCRVCPDVPIPSECPPCYEWVPQTCRECGHCARIKGCQA